MADTRKISGSFKKPTRVKIEHNGKVCYDQELPAGPYEINFDGIVPYEKGTTVISFNGDPVAEMELS